MAVLSDSAELLGCGPELLAAFPPARLSRRRSAADERTSLAPDLLRDTFAPQKVHTPPVSAPKRSHRLLSLLSEAIYELLVLSVPPASVKCQCRCSNEHPMCKAAACAACGMAG